MALVVALAAIMIIAAAGCAPAADDPAPAPSPAAPPTPAGLAGDVNPIHDPALIVAGGIWYVFSTGLVQRAEGGTIRIASSADGGRTRAQAGSVWDEIPTWIDEHFADRGDGSLPDNLWAPEIVEHDGTFSLYYSATRFGQNTSLTALATNTTLDPDDPAYRWVDRGLVVSSPVTGLPGGEKNLTFNAIDADVVSDGQGKPWLAIGSFWSGIFVLPVQWPSGKPVSGWKAETVHLADRTVAGNPIEAPYIVAHDGWFYLFVSFDRCCAGADSTYKIAIGRSRAVTGPYLDRDGTAMLGGGGGTILLETADDVVGPGGQSVHGDTLAFHYYDAANVAAPYVPTLGLRTLRWVDGWPEID